MNMRLLLISNSTNAGEKYLDHPKEKIKDFLGDQRTVALFIPYAGITISYDEYEQRVRERFNEIGHDLVSLHHFDDPAEAVRHAHAIVTGGGNTFRLSELLHKKNLAEKIRERVMEGIPYIGWSAGANIACPSISTTNDMPVVNPGSFSGLNLVPFQINPHYLDTHPEGHAGETREMRITEYTWINRSIYVVGLREGSMLIREGDSLELAGSRSVRIFKYGSEPREKEPGDDLGFLLKSP
jgi:dipeptidase E